MIAATAVLAALLLAGGPTAVDTAGLTEAIRLRIETAERPAVDQLPIITVRGDRVLDAAEVPRFYYRRAYTPAWLVDENLADVEALLAAIRRSELDGLRPTDYHLDRLEQLVKSVSANRAAGRTTATEALVDLELLLTDAFLVLGSHLLIGRVEPTLIDPVWVANRRNVDMVPILEGALITGSIEGSLIQLLPPYIEYRALRDALARYRRVQREGGWPRIEQGGTMRPGDRGAQVSALRARLAATRDLDPRQQRGEVYDGAVELAVRRFQQRHGLSETGVVDLGTLTELTAPVEQRIEQLIVNMERWRWLPQDLGVRHARVNIAGFDFRVFDESKEIMRMRALVGHQYRRTPVFSDTISLVVFAPWWGVPRTIAVQDIVPVLATEGTEYLSRNRIHVRTRAGARVDPERVNWATVDTVNFPYHFRQEPGPTNPLGRVKFLFPNSFDVYVHDTFAPEMFELAERAYSSGCIRIEHPAELAAYLLRAAPEWTPERIAQAMDSGTELTVRAPEPLPIHILYWTAWGDDDGRIHFRNDIYLRDEPLQRALEAPAPSAAGG